MNTNSQTNSQENNVKELRRSARIEVKQPIQIIDLQKNAKMGSVVNLNKEGLMLVSREKPEQNRIYQIALQLPESTSTPSKIELIIDCLWVNEDSGQGLTWAGCEIIDAEDNAIEAIEYIISNQE